MIDLDIGRLVEPLSGRFWDPPEVHRETALRAGRFTSLGLAPGDRVVLAFGNSLEFFAELMAIWRLGACAIPVDARLTAFEMGNLARAAGAKCAVVDESASGEVIAPIEASGAIVVSTQDVGHRESGRAQAGLDVDALMLFTSGSTGDPKGVVHTHRSLRARWLSLRDRLPAAAFARTLCMLPTHFGHGLICNCLFPWLSGNELHITPPFRPDLLTRLGKIIDEGAITFMSSVPAIWKLAIKLATPPKGGTLRRVHVGSAPLSAQAWDDIRKWTGTRQVCNAYGITETGSWAAGLVDADVEAEDGLIGTGWGTVIAVLRSGETPLPPTAELRCAPGDPGCVWLNTSALMKGYFRRDDLTDKAVSNGWFTTGDIGFLDDRGRLYLRGRERDEINKGGMKIYPSDIDAVVERFPAARDVCAFALDDATYG
ncbi:MAG: class I adenylate-forming enzyme family protein, partial [Steroidobacteraceae bacterium]